MNSIFFEFIFFVGTLNEIEFMKAKLKELYDTVELFETTAQALLKKAEEMKEIIKSIYEPTKKTVQNKHYVDRAKILIASQEAVNKRLAYIKSKTKSAVNKEKDK